MGYQHRRTPLWWCLQITVWILLSAHVAVADPSQLETAPSSSQADLAGQTNEPLTLYKRISDAVDLSIGLSTGLRFDEFKWSIAGNSGGTSPNTLSELEWNQVLSHQLSLGGTLEVKRRFYCRGQGNIAWIQSGSVRDSDYDGDDRTLEYSRSISETNGDEMYDLVVGAGYPIHLIRDRLFLAPLTGISYHVQNFRITNGDQVISDPPRTPPAGPLDSRLNSTYSAHWFGLWIGCDLRYLMEAPNQEVPPIVWELNLMYHFLGDYSAEADWNLRGDLDHPNSFEHDADGEGISLTVKCQIPVHQRVGFHLMVSYARWTTDEGDATIYETGGTSHTQLNEAEWETHSVMIGVDCRFF